MSKKTDTARPAGEEAAAENAEAVAPAVKAKPVKAAAPRTLVYCGPSVRNVVRQYTVFSGELPEALNSFLDKHPIARALLVPLDAFAETRSKLEVKGTAEAVLFAQIKNEL